MGKLIVANWKLNPTTLQEAVSLAKEIDSENLVICPPFPFLEAVGRTIKKSVLGAQDLFWEGKGAFTGEVSGSELKSLGVKYVIVGHSEKRRLGDTDEIVSRKVEAALNNGIIPILCVGENREEHDAGKSKEVIESQLKKDLSLVASSHTLNLVIAYEPVWAISTESGAKPDIPENTVEMIKYIKEISDSMFHVPCSVSMIYGGSVNAQNVYDFLKNKEIQGALVGSASLKPEEMKKITAIAEKC